MAQSTPRMPSWLSAYLGASEESRHLGQTVESSYKVDATPGEVLSHYRRLFQAAGLPFRPGAGGNGFMIRTATEECDLFIRIRRTDSGTAVQATCSIGVDGPGHTGRVLSEAEATHRRGTQTMEKYDQPVYPPPKQTLPTLAWPAWLVRIDGAPFHVTRGTDRFGIRYLHAEFFGGNSRNDIQSYYADLLRENGYEVSSRSLPAAPASRKAWVEGQRYANGQSGPKLVIRIELTPAEQGVSVDLRIASRR